MIVLSIKQFVQHRAHVARHLEQMALFALPRIYSDETNDADSRRAEAGPRSLDDTGSALGSQSNKSEGELGIDPANRPELSEAVVEEVHDMDGRGTGMAGGRGGMAAVKRASAFLRRPQKDQDLLEEP